MAKNMARLEKGVVVNIEWCSDRQPDTDELKLCEGYAVCIGDSWKDGRFWRNGEAVLSDLQLAQHAVEVLTAQNEALEAALKQVVDAEYSGSKGVSTCTNA